MTAKTPKAIPASQPLYVTSDAPGGFLPSEELDRANAFASKRLALEAVLAAPRDQVAQAARAACAGWAGMFSSHTTDLMRAADKSDEAGHVRHLEAFILAKIDLFKWGESCAAGGAPKHPDRDQLHATELARLIAVESEKHRVRYKNY